MIKPLRTYHFFIWRVLALVLPVVFVLAILWRPSNRNNTNSNTISVVSKIETDSSIQIVFNVKDSISAKVYAQSPEREIIVGEIGNKGKYTFGFPLDLQKITIRDIIHQKELFIKRYILKTDSIH